MADKQIHTREEIQKALDAIQTEGRKRGLPVANIQAIQQAVKGVARIERLMVRAEKFDAKKKELEQKGILPKEDV